MQYIRNDGLSALMYVIDHDWELKYSEGLDLWEKTLKKPDLKIKQQFHEQNFNDITPEDLYELL